MNLKTCFDNIQIFFIDVEI